METGEDICSVCLLEIQDKCVTPCEHCFCKSCIVQALVRSYPRNKCPVCRRIVTLQSVTHNDVSLLPRNDINTIFGSIYIQGNVKGLASYHFDSIEDCYISYENSLCAMWPNLDDGSRPPEKKSFVNSSFDITSRTFKGDIVWSPVSWQNLKLWRYEMVFSEDFESIESGFCILYQHLDEEEPNERHFFDFDLIYKRYDEEVVELLRSLSINSTN